MISATIKPDFDGGKLLRIGIKPEKLLKLFKAYAKGASLALDSLVFESGGRTGASRDPQGISEIIVL